MTSSSSLGGGSKEGSGEGSSAANFSRGWLPAPSVAGDPIGKWWVFVELFIGFSMGVSMGLEASTIEIGINHNDLVDDGKKLFHPFLFPKDELEKDGD